MTVAFWLDPEAVTCDNFHINVIMSLSFGPDLNLTPEEAHLLDER